MVEVERKQAWLHAYSRGSTNGNDSASRHMHEPAGIDEISYKQRLQILTHKLLV